MLKVKFGSDMWLKKVCNIEFYVLTNHSYLELEKKRLTGVRTNISTTYHGQKKGELRLFNVVDNF